jgi:integrase
MSASLRSSARSWQAPRFQGYSPATREVWGRELRLAERPDTLGAISVNVIRPALVQAFMDGMSDRPGKQAAALAALRQLERWGIVRDLLPQPITLGVEIGRSHDGHKPWTDEQVLLVETHARPELARVVTLAANTGQRGSDLVKMRWTDLEDYNGRTGINVTQLKTGRQIWVPITQELASAMAQWERRPGFILLRPTGIPWTRKALTWAWTSSATAIWHYGLSPALCCTAYVRRRACGFCGPGLIRGRSPTWSGCQSRSWGAIAGSQCSAKTPRRRSFISTERLANVRRKSPSKAKNSRP